MTSFCCMHEWHQLSGHSQIQTLELGMEQRYVVQSNTIHRCTLLAGGLNEYIWQAWAYLEAKQNNIGQARKVRSSTPYCYAHAVCCIKGTLCPHGHDVSLQAIVAKILMQYCRDLHEHVVCGAVLTHVLSCSCLMLPWLQTVSMQPPGMAGVCLRRGKATSERLGTCG